MANVDFCSSGRNPVYLGSLIGFFIFSWPVAFAPSIGVYYLFLLLPRRHSLTVIPPIASRSHLFPFRDRSLRRRIPLCDRRYHQRPLHFVRNWEVGVFLFFPCRWPQIPAPSGKKLTSPYFYFPPVQWQFIAWRHSSGPYLGR